jgi:hypothetical protein
LDGGRIYKNEALLEAIQCVGKLRFMSDHLPFKVGKNVVLFRMLVDRGSLLKRTVCPLGDLRFPNVAGPLLV